MSKTALMTVQNERMKKCLSPIEELKGILHNDRTMEGITKNQQCELNQKMMKDRIKKTYNRMHE